MQPSAPNVQVLIRVAKRLGPLPGAYISDFFGRSGHILPPYGFRRLPRSYLVRSFGGTDQPSLAQGFGRLCLYIAHCRNHGPLLIGTAFILETIQFQENIMVLDK